MFIDVRDCSLRVIGVPVNFPVKIHQMTWWEESDSRPLACLCLLLHSVCFNSALMACAGVQLFQYRSFVDKDQKVAERDPKSYSRRGGPC